MDIDKLLALKTLADEGTQIRAAEKLFCTQSALSKQIGTLERELDCRLFDPESICFSLFITADAERRHQFQNFAPLCNSAMDFFLKSSHILLSAAINDLYFFGAQTYCGSCNVHSHISAAHYDHSLSGKIHGTAFSGIPEHFHC